jgi:tight adherence protein C
LRDRVDPYVGGFEGRPSRLLRSGEGNAGTRLTPVIRRLFPTSGRELQIRLDVAGVGLSIDSFRLEQLVWGFAGAIGGVAMLMLSRLLSTVDLRAIPLMMIVCFIAGFLARDWWLGHQIEQRTTQLASALPVAIDLVTLCVMAGESVPAACGRVAQTLPSGIGVEFARVVADVRAGSPIIEALGSMSRRIPDPDVGRFVDTLCTGIEKGAPLAETLRAQAEDGRESRRRRLLELGGRREVLMLVPVVFLIMPTVVAFALWPGLVSLDLLVP